MDTGSFKFEDCLLKHYVRTEAWLPLCKNRKRTIRRSGTKKARERMVRYFTFCASGAIDVLMLNVERVIDRSPEGWFDRVCFFDRTKENVAETQKRIPGAVGFPGNFTKIVLLRDQGEQPSSDETEPLEPLTDRADTLKTQEAQRQLAQHRKFVQQFPFDIVNLDLEEFLFKPNDPIPGRVVNALRKVFGWQKRPIVLSGSGTSAVSVELDGFSLMFTTQIGPPNLNEGYLAMLERYMTENIARDPELETFLRERTNQESVADLRANSFPDFFRLAMPKTLMKILMEEDWYADPNSGITLFEIERPSRSGPYKILHLVMDVKRQRPARENRAPGTDGEGVGTAYREVVRTVFSNREVSVTEALIDQDLLQAHLDTVRARGREYMGEG
jgi:hypothetical protein